MKKSFNKGFMLVETLMVASFISITLVYLFVQFRNININYNNSLSYNSVNGMYINNQIKNFLRQYDIESLSKEIAYGNVTYYDLKDCSLDIYTDKEYCNMFYNTLNIKNVYYISEKINADTSKFSGELFKYVNTLTKEDGDMFLIVSEFTDGSFANLKMNGYDFSTLSSSITSQTITNNASGLYYINDKYIYRGNADEINNNIELFGINGKIISYNDSGVKVILDKIQDTIFDSNYSAFTKNNLLTTGGYVGSNINSSTIFNSLNKDRINDSNIIYNSYFSVGNVDSVINNTINNILTMENAVIYQGNEDNNYVSTLNISDIIFASINADCNLYNISNDCLRDNYLSDNLWTMSASDTNHVWAITNSEFTSSMVSETNNAYKVLYVDPNVKVMGDGSVSYPYRIIK